MMAQVGVAARWAPSARRFRTIASMISSPRCSLRPRVAFAMVTKAIELAETHGWFLTRQFENEADPDFHSRTTAREIVADFAGEKLDYWVTGYGTGGTLKGVARVLAKEMADTKIVVCEPEDAPLLSSGIEQARKLDGSAASPHPAFKPHPMQGFTPDFI